MSDKLAIWYAKGGKDIPGETISLRKASVEAYCHEDVYTKYIESLCNLFFDLKKDYEYESLFAEFMAREDEAFTADRREEMKILAGDILYTISVEGSKRYLQVELWFMMMHFCGNDGYVPEISCEIRKELYNESANIREYAYDLTSVDVVTKLNVKFEAKATDETPDPVYEYNAYSAQNLDKMVKTLNSVVCNHNELVDKCEQSIRLLHEDTQIIWWLLGERDDKSGKHYSDMPVEDAIFLCACNLADKVVEMPGPYAADALLGRMIRDLQGERELCIADFVDNVNKELTEMGDVSTPIMFALKRKGEDGSGHWYQVVENRFGLKHDTTIARAEICYEIYLERLYQRLIKEDQ